MLLLGAGWVGCLVTCLAAGRPPEPGLTALLLGLLMVGLDLAAARLPGLGFVSCSAAVSLAVAHDPRLGPGWAALTSCVSLLLRAGLRPGHPQPGLRLLEHLAEGAPGLAAITCLRLVGSEFAPAWASLVYFNVWLAVVWLQSSVLPLPLAQLQRTVQFRLVWIRLACCSLGLGLSPVSPMLVGILLPVLLGLRQASLQAVQLQEQLQRSDVVRQLHKSSQDQQSLRQGLAQKEDEYRVLERACQQLLGCQSRSQTGARIAELVAQLCGCDSVVVWALEAGQWRPIGGRATPISSLVVQVASEGLIQCGRPLLFEEEGQALAFPLGRLGVLYVGRREQPFPAETLRHLTMAASVAGLGLHISILLEDLRGWSQALANLLGHSLSFLESNTVAELAASTREAASSLFGACECRVDLPARPASLLETQALEQGRLLAEECADGSGLWLVCAPLLHPILSEPGLIVLKAPQAPGQGELLPLLANLTAIAWKNLYLRAEIVTAQGKLLQSAKLAAVGQLAAGVAHELNTPLSSVGLNLDLAARLLQSAPNAQVQDRLQRATDGVLRSKEIIDNLLLYSRQESAGRAAADLRDIVAQALELIRQPLALGGVEVVLDLQPVPLLEVTSTEIQQVLMNLLLNARDAVEELPAERRQIVVRTESSAAGVRLRVLDQGTGIAAEHQARIFEPFYTTKPVGKGTGLGLSICEQIAKAHGARLEMTSRPGEGCEFCLVFPQPV